MENLKNRVLAFFLVVIFSTPLLCSIEGMEKHFQNKTDPNIQVKTDIGGLWDGSIRLTGFISQTLKIKIHFLSDPDLTSDSYSIEGMTNTFINFLKYKVTDTNSNDSFTMVLEGTLTNPKDKKPVSIVVHFKGRAYNDKAMGQECLNGSLNVQIKNSNTNPDLSSYGIFILKKIN